MNLKVDIIKEIIPLTPSDCFSIFSRVKTKFDFPLHIHEEYELNLILNAKGAKRIIGDHISVIDDVELVLVGPNLPHVWLTHECTTEITEITIQWHKDLLGEKFLNRNQMGFIKQMFDKSVRGIAFDREDVLKVVDRLRSLKNANGFNSVMELLSILNDLSTAKRMTLLTDSGFLHAVPPGHNSRRLEKAYDFMHNNYHKEISLGDIAELASMTEASFSRFFKKRTGNTFIGALNEIRLGNACRMLIDTTHSVTEVSYSCGFNNISNFNRLFKKRKQCTPKEFRENYAGNRIVI